MVKKLRNILVKVSLVGLVALPMLAPAAVYADTEPSIEGNLCGGADNLQVGETGTCDETDVADAQNRVNDIIATVINILSVVVGVVAVIMIIFGGFRYVTSGGDSGNVSSAKNTILFAVVGLVIVALAQVVVRFVLARATNTEGAAGI